jgi:L-threonylcarbamoyladenylate synthase
MDEKTGEQKINYEEALLSGKVFIYPTDTLYGIGGNAMDKKVVDRVYEIKKREARKPLSVIMANLEMIQEYCDLNKQEKAVLKKHLPGPFTFIIRLKREVRMPVTDTEFLGVRIPSHPFAVGLSRQTGLPIISTSANISGEKDAFKVDDIDPEIKNKVDFILDQGETKFKQGSTVVDLEKMIVLRKGAGEFAYW